MDHATRDRLRAALLTAAPWLAATDVGPRAVEAGRCDACDVQPRLLPTCGPGAPGSVCRDCALRLGEDGWCDGHRADGASARAWASALPERWADLVIAWWVATGEVRTGAWPQLDPSTLPSEVGRALRATSSSGLGRAADVSRSSDPTPG